MKIGLLGVGKIAEMVAPAVVRSKGVICEAVAARDLERAQAFAQKWGFKKAYGSYEELLDDSDVDVIYIGTPHSFHYEQMMQSMKKGKGVFCEKAFCINSRQAELVRDYARKHGVFAAEAVWTRYMPSRKTIQNLLESGIIGTPSVLSANLFYPISEKERIYKPELAGGALLDVGVYPINFALMCFGNDVIKIESAVKMHATGVDGAENITLTFADGKMAFLSAGIYSRSDRKGVIHGDKGYMIVENINNPESVSIYDVKDQLLKQIVFTQKVNGYEYEFEELARMFDEGKIETQSMSLDDTLQVLKICDTLRKDWGFVFPQEE